MRGYQAPADRLAALLNAGPDGADTDGLPALEAALAAAGRRPGDYSGRIDVELDPQMPAAQAMALVLGTLLGHPGGQCPRHDRGHRHRVPA